MFFVDIACWDGWVARQEPRHPGKLSYGSAGASPSRLSELHWILVHHLFLIRNIAEAISLTLVNIIYHSTQGHTERLANAVAEGAQTVPGVSTKVIRVIEAEPHHVTECQGMVLGSPTHMGNVSAPMKTFMDEIISPIWINGGIPGTVGAAFTSSGSIHGDKEFAILAMLITMTQLGMTLVSLPPTGIKENKKLGYSRGVGTSVLGSHASMMPKEDLVCAQQLGIRVAEVAKKLHA